MKRRFSAGNVYIATVCAQHREIAREYGMGLELDQFCMAERMEGEQRKEAEKEIAQLLAEVGRPSVPLLLHAPFNELFPGAIDPKALSLAMERYCSAARITGDYRAEKMIVHSGYMPFVYFKEWHIEKSVEFWESFMAKQPETLHITIENVLEDEPYMMARMMENIRDPRIRLCLDVGHAGCMSKVPLDEWIDVLAPYLGHLHIHNNDGKNDLHQPVMEGIVPMRNILQQVLEKCGQLPTLTIESMDGESSAAWLVNEGFLQDVRSVGTSCGWERQEGYGEEVRRIHKGRCGEPESGLPE